MRYNFDEEIDRKNTFSIEWNFMNIFFPENDLLSVWVADMGFKFPHLVIEVLNFIRYNLGGI